MNPFYWLSDPAHATAAFWLLVLGPLLMLLGLVKGAELAWSQVRRVRCAAQLPDPDLLAAPEVLLEVDPDEAGDVPSFDPEPELVTLSETFGPASAGYFDSAPLPHREPPPPCPAEIEEAVNRWITVAIRETRAAATGGAR